MSTALPIKIDGVTYQVEIEDLNVRPIVVTVDGERFEVWPENEAVEKPAFTGPALSTAGFAPPPAAGIGGPAGSAAANLVRAPIPGVIVGLRVRPGEAVAYGQELFTIEAMKMRNAIRATRSGWVGDVLVSQGQTVGYDDILMTYAQAAPAGLEK